jgi:hypothetical protein
MSNTHMHTLSVMSLTVLSAVMTFVPVNFSPTHPLSEEDVSIITEYAIPEPRKAIVEAPAPADAAPVPAPVRIARQTAEPVAVREAVPIGSYRMRDRNVTRVVAKQAR